MLKLGNGTLRPELLQLHMHVVCAHHAWAPYKLLAPLASCTRQFCSTLACALHIGSNLNSHSVLCAQGQIVQCVYFFLAGVVVSKRHLLLLGPAACFMFGLLRVAIAWTASRSLPSFRHHPRPQILNPAI